MGTHRLDASVHREAKRLIGQAAPRLKSSHRAEAIARGLGFNTNAALQAALDHGPVEADVSREAFEGFLKDRGYDVETLQVSLLADAVILASGGTFEEPKVAPGGRENGPWLECWFCLDGFVGQGAHNRICHDCNERDGRVPGVYKATEVIEAHLSKLLERGKPPSLDRLRARPGWSDVLDGDDFLAKSAQALRIRSILNDGDPDRMKRPDRKFLETYGGLRVNQPWARPAPGRRRSEVR